MRWAQLVSVLPLWLSWSASSYGLIVREKPSDDVLHLLFSRETTKSDQATAPETGPAVRPKTSRPAVRGQHPEAPNPNLALLGYRTIQLGRGVYTTPDLNAWLDAGWQCAIFADKEKLKAIPKVVVSRRFYQQTRQHDPTMEIHAYIRNFYRDIDPRRCLLLGYIDEGPELQMLIPFDLLNAYQGGLNITVECASSGNMDALRNKVDVMLDHNVRVNYSSWDNVLGDLSDDEYDYDDYKYETAGGKKESEEVTAFMKLRTNDDQGLARICPNPSTTVHAPRECVQAQFGGNARKAFTGTEAPSDTQPENDAEPDEYCNLGGLEQGFLNAFVEGQRRSVDQLQSLYPVIAFPLLALLASGICLPHEHRIRRGVEKRQEYKLGRPKPAIRDDTTRQCCQLSQELMGFLVADNPQLLLNDWEAKNRIRALAQVIDVRINNIDNEALGELYGRITVRDPLGPMTVYDVARDSAQDIYPGDLVRLTDGERVIEGSEPFSISVELYDRDRISSDDLISEGLILWRLDDPHDQIFSTELSGDSGSATIRWTVMQFAASANIQVVLIDGDGESPANIFGSCKLRTRTVSRTWFDVPEQGNFDVYKGNLITGIETTVAVAEDDILEITVDVFDHDVVSSPDSVAKGTVGFYPEPGKTVKKRVKGESGEVEVVIHQDPPQHVKRIIAHGRCSVGEVDETTVLKFPLTPEDMKRIRIEAKILSALGQHPRIVRSKGLVKDGLLLELAPNGNLRDYLVAHPEASLERRLAWCVQATEAVAYIHSKRTLHCDIRHDNFLLDANLDLMLADFQGQHFSADGEVLLDALSAESTKSYLPRQPADHASVRTDLFALGSTIYFIMMGQEVFPDLDKFEDEDETERRFRAGEFPTDVHVCAAISAKCWRQLYASASQALSDLEQSVAANEPPENAIKLLDMLKKDAAPTEEMLRATRAGVFVGKLRGNPNKEIARAAMELVNKWKKLVEQEKNSKLQKAKMGSPALPAASPPSSAPPQSSAASTTTAATKKTFTGDPEKRKYDSDGVDIKRTASNVRNQCIGLVYNGLAFRSTESASNVIAKAVAVEQAVFDSFGSENAEYKKKVRSLFANLKNKSNKELGRRVMTGDITPDRFASMTDDDLKSEDQRKKDLELEKENMKKAQVPMAEKSISDSLECGRCKKKRVSYTQAQTRAADEPMTTFCECMNCGHRWKFS
ncbi:hypothetical protein CP532_2269 [Ophiocordyceps camponoti-leonardi (nom. inval.)]|nr:hypothetical protein CP532_2269 [Ophiocordyceps camponoti-leonardi (nom. inval.)]